jgi:hypothetical protein
VDENIKFIEWNLTILQEVQVRILF